MKPVEPYLEDDLPLKPGDAVATVILAPDGRYVLQLRDRMKGIFFPDHWGFFGGGVESSDSDLKAAMRRELQEELGVDVAEARFTFFTRMTYDFTYCGLSDMFRMYYEVRLTEAEMQSAVLGEGSAFAAFTLMEALNDLRLVPYDEMALWMHANGERMRPRAGEAVS
jgi:8-oxo-dGTP pyrophosphatase MutT (NUDIX family)